MQLFKDQESYFDIPTSTLTPIQIRAKLAELAASVTGSSDDKFKDALTLKGSKNGGTDVTEDLKWTSTLNCIIFLNNQESSQYTL